MIRLYRQLQNSDAMVMIETNSKFRTTLDLFTRLVGVLNGLAEFKTNIHYSVHSSKGGNAREFISGHTLIWDVEETDYTQMPKYLACFSDFAKLETGKFSVVQSGHGLHFIIHLSKEAHWESELYFKTSRIKYKFSCNILQGFLAKYELPGTVDPLGFSSGKTLRLPGTVNAKKGKEPKQCSLFCLGSEVVYSIERFNLDVKKGSDITLARKTSEPLKEIETITEEALDPISELCKVESTASIHYLPPPDFLPTLDQVAEITASVDTMMESMTTALVDALEPAIPAAEVSVARDTLPSEVLEALPPESCGTAEFTGSVDTEAILDGCKFLNYMELHQEAQTEGQWFALISILSKLPGGEKLVHDYSSGYGKYSYAETEKKFLVAKEKPPHTCKGVEVVWDGCRDCVNYCKVKTPCSLKSIDFIRTQSTGFWDISINSKTGAAKRTPNYEDLLKHYGKTHTYINILESGLLYAWNDSYFEEYPECKVNAWCYDTMEPKCRTMVQKEFLGTLNTRNHEKLSFFTESTMQKLNLRNGVFSLTNFVLLQKSPKFGFTSELPYDYDPLATCPMFDKFMNETLPDPECQKVVIDFLAYAMSGVAYTNDAFLLFQGEGSNGKSTLREIMNALFDRDFKNTDPSEFTSTHGLTDILGKKIVYCNEFPKATESAFWDMAKKIVSLEPLMINPKYGKPYEVINTARLIICCNEMPNIITFDDAIKRRLYIIPFKTRYSEEQRVLGLAKIIIAAELPGIFNRVLVALKELVARNYMLKKPAISVKIYEDLKLDRDHILRFIRQNYEYCPVGTVESLPLPFVNREYEGAMRPMIPLQAMYQELKGYYEDQGLDKKPTVSMLAKALRKEYGDSALFSSNYRTREVVGAGASDVHKTTYVVGIRPSTD